METKYQKLFGDLEDAAETLGEICRTCPANKAGEICDEACPLYVPGFICNGEQIAFVEWLKSEANPLDRKYPKKIRCLKCGGTMQVFVNPTPQLEGLCPKCGCRTFVATAWSIEEFGL